MVLRMQKPKASKTDQALRDLFEIDSPTPRPGKSRLPSDKRLEDTVLGYALGFLGALAVIASVIAWSMVHFAP